MQLAISDSSLSRQLLLENKIAVDYVETQGPLLDGVLSILPNQKFLLHNALWNWSLAHPNVLEYQNAVKITKQKLQGSKAPWLSVHLGFSAAEVIFDKVMQPSSKVLDRITVLEAIITNVQSLAESIAVPLLLENLDYNPSGAYEFICEPSFISEVFERTNTAMLLDIAHARVSASRLGIDIKNYFAALPMKCVRQLHISGPRPDGHTLHDAHEPLQGEDYELLEYVLSMTNPHVLTLEYSKNEDRLLEQWKQLQSFVSQPSL